MEEIDKLFERFKEKEIPQWVKDRKTHNKEILQLLETFLEEYPTLRFEQALHVLLRGKIDFYKESVETKKQIETFLNQ